MRPKSLIGDVESVFDERQEQMTEGGGGGGGGVGGGGGGGGGGGPHLVFSFPVRSVVSDCLSISLCVYELVKIRRFTS